MNVEMPLEVIKTQAMREIEAKYDMPIDQVLKNLASEGLGKTEIGKKLHVNRRTISDWFDNLDIGEVEVKKFRKTPLMLGIEQRFKKLVEHILRNKYIDQKKSLPTVAHELRVDENTVRRWLSLFEIQLRSPQEGRALALEDPKKRKKMYRRPKKLRKKIAKSLKRYHRDRREKARNSA
ncbi:MAG: hypothetical protein AAB675_02790 [Patescibacteria group bacterium]